MVVVAAGFWAGETQAQIDPLPIPGVANTRALIQSFYHPMGFTGRRPQFLGGAYGLGYPSNGASPGSYGGVLSSYQSGEKATYSYAYSTSMGEGTWILTSDSQISVTGPRNSPWIGRFNRAVPYDPKGKPEETWGVPNPVRTLWKGAGNPPNLSNYWPGITNTDVGSIYAYTTPTTTPPLWIANYNISGYIQNKDAPEEVIISQWSTTKQGFLTQCRVANWSNPDFNAFIITEYTFTNLGDFNGDGKEDSPGQTKTQDNVYFSFMNQELPTGMGSNWYQSPDSWGSIGLTAFNVDDIYKYSDAGGYQGVFPAGLKASIWRDSDYSGTSWDDTGEPFYLAQSAGGASTGRIAQTEGQLQAASTWAMLPLAYRNAGASHVFNPRDRARNYVNPQGEQPSAAKWWRARTNSDFDDPYSEKDTEKKMYDEMVAPGFKGNPNEANPDDRSCYVHAQVYGPYTLQAGQSAKIVMAYAAGHPSQMKGQDILTWDRSTAAVETKQTEMKTLGEQALLENVRLAQFAYDSEYHIPASPTEAFIAKDDLTASGNGHQQLSWVDNSDRAVNPYYNQADILGYRVYRSTWFALGPWDLRDTIVKGQAGSSIMGSWTYANGRYTYEDLQTAAGFEYHYSVRPYASGHAAWSATLSDGSTQALADIPVGRVRTNVTRGYGSGWGPATARTYDGDGSRPFQPVTTPTDNLDRKVLVVPNPFFVDDLHAYPNTRNIRFVNIPQKCKIYVYSTSGDLVRILQQNETTVINGVTGKEQPKTVNQKGEITWSQNTWNLSGFISAGLYYFVVVSETPSSMGKTQRGTFVVIK